MKPKDFAEILRQLADEVEKEGATFSVVVYDHSKIVQDPRMGNMPLDRKWLGRSIVIQSEGITLNTLLSRLIEELTPDWPKSLKMALMDQE